MSSGIEVGTAFVRILPDMTAFNAALTTQVNASTAAAVSTKAAAAATASKVAAEQDYLREVLASASTQKIAQRGVVAAAVAAAQAQIAGAESVTAANLVTAESIGAVAASYKLSAAAAVQAASVQRGALLGQAGAVAAGSNISGFFGGPRKVEETAAKAVGKSLIDTGTGANAARGALIGLARVTPVAVFGLGVIGTAAIGAGLAIKSAVSSAADFESQMLTFQAVTQSTDAEMKQVSETALALGADLSLPATTATDASTALLELSKAGLSVADSLAAAKGVLQLATVANLSAGQAAQITAGQLNAFKLAGDQATRVAELLADASIAAQGEISDFAAAFQQAGTAANQSGVSIEDTTALLTQLGRAGIRGADAGTSLRTFLLRLVPTTKEASQYTKALGIELDKNKTIGAQLPDIIEQYRTQLEKLNPQTQTLVLNQIFGQDAFRASSIIFSQQKDALKGLTGEFARTNAIEDLSAAKADGLKGAVGSLTSELQTFGTQVGLLATGPLESFVRGLTTTVDELGNMIEALHNIDILPDQFDKTLNVIFKADLGPFPNLATALGVLALGPLGAPVVITKKFLDLFKSDKTAVPSGEVLGPPNPNRPVRGVDEDQQAAAKAAVAAATKLDPALEAQVNAANKAAAEAAKKGIVIPRDLQQAQVDAQIRNSLSAELAADNAILRFFEAKLSTLKKGTDKYLAVSGQLEAAQSQRDAVQDEIDGISDKQKSEREAKRKKRVSDAKAEAEKDKAARELVRRTILEIDQQTYSNVVAKARLTPSTADDIRVRENRIKKLDAERDHAKKIRDAAKQGSQAQLDAILQVKKLNGDILSLQSEIQGLGKNGANGSSGGFSLSDLFKEALNQFQEFGSNVSSSPLTPGGVRGAFGGAIAAQNPKLTRADQEKIQKAATTNELLQQILATLKGAEPTSGTSTPGSTGVGKLTARQASSLASRRVGGS